MWQQKESSKLHVTPLPKTFWLALVVQPASVTPSLTMSQFHTSRNSPSGKVAWVAEEALEPHLEECRVFEKVERERQECMGSSRGRLRWEARNCAEGKWGRIECLAQIGRPGLLGEEVSLSTLMLIQLLEELLKLLVSGGRPSPDVCIWFPGPQMPGIPLKHFGRVARAGCWLECPGTLLMGRQPCSVSPGPLGRRN